MEKNKLKGYMEFVSCLVDYSLDAELKDLIEAADVSQIHTFGWPIGVVLHTEDKRPQPYESNGITRGVKTVINSEKHFDYWTLDKNGDYYILSGLFEDQREVNKIFLDTRTIRTTETLLRTGRLYEQLKVPSDTIVECRIEYGGLKDRKLTAANPLRAFTFSHERICSVNTVVKNFSVKLEDLLSPHSLQDIVYKIIKTITEVCEAFIPSKVEAIDPLVEAYFNGRII